VEFPTQHPGSVVRSKSPVNRPPAGESSSMRPAPTAPVTWILRSATPAGSSVFAADRAQAVRFSM
jgi:hypothetical protein